MLNGVLYVLETGCQWRHLPKDLPLRSTVHGYLQLWAWKGTLERIHHDLYQRVRVQDGREASPTAAVLDIGPAGTALRHLGRNRGCRHTSHRLLECP